MKVLRKITLIGLVMILLLAAGCNTAGGSASAQKKPYMAGHSWGETQDVVQGRGKITELMGLKVKEHVYLFNSSDGGLKSAVYEMSEEVTLDGAVEKFTGEFGEPVKGTRGEENQYIEYSWVDGDSTIFVMKKEGGEEEGNVLIQIQRNSQ